MPKPRLTPITAFGQTTPRQDTIGGVTLTELPDLAITSVALRHGATPETLEQFLGAPLPGPGRAAQTTPVDAIWTAPDQWFFLAPYDSHETLADSVKACAQTSVSVTEQSDGWTCIQLTGTDLPALLERLCMLDLAIAGAGFVARSIIHHVGCYLICDDSGHRWRVLAPRGTAGSLYEAIATQATSLAERG